MSISSDIEKVGTMSITFESFNLNEAIVKAVTEMGFTLPTEVQEKAIPLILEGNDVIVKSKTGSGKTATFAIPLFQKLGVDPSVLNGKPKALILTPTRELAVQVDAEVERIGRYTGISHTAVYGQHNILKEYEVLDEGVTIITGTPGRVIDHIEQGSIDTSEIAYFCIDEADKMLDMGFVDQVVHIVEALPKNRTTLLFSATMPVEIQHICKQYMNAPETIAIASETETVDSIEQVYHRVQKVEKRTQLRRVLREENPRSCLVFCNTRYTVERVADDLCKRGYAAAPLHGAISQARRLATINDFKDDKFSVLVATDVAARGIHVNDLSLVVNYDVPVEKDSYVHRIGRTGRAGNGGKAITFVTKDDLMTLYEIEEHIGVLIEEKPLPVVAKHVIETDYEDVPKRLNPQRVVKLGSNGVTDQKDLAPIPKSKETLVQKPWWKRLLFWVK